MDSCLQNFSFFDLEAIFVSYFVKTTNATTKSQQYHGQREITFLWYLWHYYIYSECLQGYPFIRVFLQGERAQIILHYSFVYIDRYLRWCNNIQKIYIRCLVLQIYCEGYLYLIMFINKNNCLLSIVQQKKTTFIYFALIYLNHNRIMQVSRSSSHCLLNLFAKLAHIDFRSVFYDIMYAYTKLLSFKLN